MPHERDKFKPRELSAVEVVQLTNHVKRVEVLSNAGVLPADWRSWIERDFSKCPHTVMTMVEIENDYGIWGMEICVACGVQVRKECPHIRCDWNEDGSVLRCGNCGVDAT